MSAANCGMRLLRSCPCWTFRKFALRVMSLRLEAGFARFPGLPFGKAVLVAVDGVGFAGFPNSEGFSGLVPKLAPESGLGDELMIEAPQTRRRCPDCVIV